MNDRTTRADASMADLDPQFVVALEVQRLRGNRQRNLVVMVEARTARRALT